MKTNSLLHFFCFFFWVILPSFVLLPLHGQSQAPNFIITNYTVEDGLPSNETYRIVQDSLGYIWIATDRGLVRWDGYEFKVYGSGQGLSNITVLMVKLDENGTPWLCTIVGDLYFYDYSTDRLIPYQFNAQIKEYIGGNKWPRKFSVDKNGEVTFISGKPVVRINSKGNQIELYRRDIGTENNARHYFHIGDEVFYQDYYNSNLKVIGTDYNGNPRYERINYLDRFEFPNCYNPMPNNKYSNIIEGYKYSDGKILIMDAMINYFFKNGEFLFCREESHGIVDLKFDTSDALYVAKLNNGGLLYCESDHQLESDECVEVISGISMGGILIDRVGDIWVCSLENGIYRIKKNKIKEITDKGTRRIQKYKKGIALIGAGNELIILNREYEEVYQKVFSKELRGLFYSAEHDLLFIPGKESYYMNSDFELNEIFYHSIGHFQNVSLHSICQLNNDIVYGLAPTFYTIYEDQHALDNGRCANYLDLRNLDLDFYKDAHYVATVSGLFKQADIYANGSPLQIQGLSMRVNDLEVDQNLLLMGTNDQGLLAWDGDSIVGSLNKSEGLLSNSVEIIHKYDNDFILVGTKNGISIVKNNSGTFKVVKNVTTSFGLASNDIKDLEVVGDQIYYASPAGAGVFTFDASIADSTEVVFDGWNVNDLERRDFIYSASENNVSINYKTIDFRQEGKINYRYRLNNQDWNDTRNTSVNYAALRPGQYQFEVQSQNENGIWGHIQYREFRINKPWWGTWWFRAIVGLGIIGIGYYFYQRRIKEIEQKAVIKEKEAAVSEEIRQLELQALRAQMNPHFIFNCLTSIQRFIQKNESENAMSYLSKFAKLVRQTLNASSEEIHSLQDELNMLENYLDLEKLRFKSLFDYNFEIENGLDPYSISIPPMLIQPLVENAIKHGFQGIDYPGKILIRINQKNTDIEIEIEDNGKGISDTPILPHRKSFGSSITARRLELINLSQGTLEVAQPSTGQGTLVRMRIPQ